MHVGFTGTRKGLTPVQRKLLKQVVLKLPHKGVTFHHGDCKGADEEFHYIVREVRPKCKVVGHPPISERHRAHCYFDEEREPKDYLPRDDDIVEESDRMIACPGEDSEVKRGSGTWYTIRQSRRTGTDHTIVGPTGNVKQEIVL